MTGIESRPPELECGGFPPLCPRCHSPLVPDPTGPWCRTCRTAHQGTAPWTRCAEQAAFTGLLGPYRGTRLCPGHAAETSALLGPDAVRADH